MLRPGPDGALLVPDRAYARAFTLRMGHTDQSYVDLDDPLRLEFDYVQRIADVIDTVFPTGQRIRVLHVGGAALTLPRYLTATRPTSAQIVLEPDAELTAFIRRSCPCRRAAGSRSGRATVGPGWPNSPRLRSSWSCSMRSPDRRCRPNSAPLECFADIRRVLGDSGVLIMNVTDRGLGYARRVLAGLAQVFAHAVLCAEPSTLKGRRFGNVILVAADQPLPADALAQRAGLGPFPYRVLTGARLDQLRLGAHPFTDADAEPSPPPPTLMGFLG